MKKIVAAASVILSMFNCKKYNGLHFTTSHTGKMTGMYSISTSCNSNEYCKRRAKIKNSICSRCYAMSMTNGRCKSMDKPLRKNTEILTSHILTDEEIPFINAFYFRFEAFGDLVNEIQVVNYFSICRKNPKVNFALWTKNPLIIKWAMKKYGVEKPENLNILFSSCMIDIQVDTGKIRELMPYIDKVFTVWTNEKAAEENGQKINCGARHCLTCGKCYEKNSVVNINELLK
jgi:hypothetical protein